MTKMYEITVKPSMEGAPIEIYNVHVSNMSFVRAILRQHSWEKASPSNIPTVDDEAVAAPWISADHNHEFKPGFSGRTCVEMVTRHDGIDVYGDSCGLPAHNSIHIQEQ